MDILIESSETDSSFTDIIIKNSILDVCVTFILEII